MILTDSKPMWNHQIQGVNDVVAAIEAGKRKICLTSPTGGGKTRMITALIEWAHDRGWYNVLYTNRRLLIEQLQGVLEKSGIEHGVRAAGHQDERDLPIQISSLPTERARVLKAGKWNVHGSGSQTLAIVDEGHLNAHPTACKILQRHLDDGGAYVLVTATPTDLAHVCDTLIVAGTPSELRKCGALVKAYHIGVDEPDMRKFKASAKTGEYMEADVVKAIMHKNVFGRVLENWTRLNPDARPTLLFAPGVAESIWFAEQFHKAGVSAASIDGEGMWIDGSWRRASLKEREEVLQACRDGDIKVLCNRFVLREGLDLPAVEHVILATVMGSLKTYLQSVGRGMRASPDTGKEALVIQDHGGHYWRHGSVNVDRQWNLSHTDRMIASIRADRLRDGLDPEPIRCPSCGLVRAGGKTCPKCGYESTRRSRMVVQQDGSLTEHDDPLYAPRKVQERPTTAGTWKNMYYRAKNSKNGMTFRQAEALFYVENYYWPPHTLPLMPTLDEDWYSRVRDVPFDRLVPKKETGLFND